MAKVCSRCKASVEARVGEPCPACQQPFYEEVSKEIQARAEERLAKMRAEIKAASAKKSAPAAPVVVEPVAEPEPPPQVVVEMPAPEPEPVATPEPAAPFVDPVVGAAPAVSADELVREIDDAAASKKFRSERIRLKPPAAPSAPAQKAAIDSLDPVVPRERVELPAFVPLVAGIPALPPPPPKAAKAKPRPRRSGGLRLGLLVVLLGVLGFGAWQMKLVEIPFLSMPTPEPAATEAALAHDATPALVATPPHATAVTTTSHAPAIAATPLAPVTALRVPATPADPKAEALIRALASFNKGEFDDTVAELKSILETHDDFADAHSLLGTTFARQGDALGACEEYARYLELAPVGPKADQIRKASADCAH